MQTWLLTFTVKVHVAVAALLWLVHVTVVVPTRKLEPEGGSQGALGAEQLSLTVGGG